MKSASVLKLNTAFKPEPSEAEIDRRHALNDHRARLIYFSRDVEIRARQMLTSEESTKRPLRAFHDSVTLLRKRCSAFSDSYDNRDDIAAAAAGVKEYAAEVLRLDPALVWVANQVFSAIAPLLAFLEQDLPTRTPPGSDERTVNLLRWHLLNEIDELTARLMTLGDLRHGGLESRRPVIAQAGDLRKEIAADMYANVDGASVVAKVQAIKDHASRLGDLPSEATGQTGFMNISMPAIHAQCGKIVAMVQRDALVARASFGGIR